MDLAKLVCGELKLYVGTWRERDDLKVVNLLHQRRKRRLLVRRKHGRNLRIGSLNECVHLLHHRLHLIPVRRSAILRRLRPRCLLSGSQVGFNLFDLRYLIGSESERPGQPLKRYAGNRVRPERVAAKASETTPESARSTLETAGTSRSSGSAWGRTTLIAWALRHRSGSNRCKGKCRQQLKASSSPDLSSFHFRPPLEGIEHRH